MKKILYYILALAFSFGVNSCDLDTEPTNQISSALIFETADAAETAMNGIYRACYISEKWSTNWASENFGITSVTLLSDLMAEDHLMATQGNGWFYEDYRLNVYQDYTNTSGRPYAIWKFYYTLISNTNYIINSESVMGGDAALKNSVLGQAYAMRAYAYFYLAQFYQQTYVGNEEKPGVPLYLEPTTSNTKGIGRGTLRETYAQINLDIDKAITLLKESGVSQKHKSNVDYYIANGIKARIALVQNDFTAAKDAATIALSKPGLKSVATVAETDGFNSITFPNVMWGFEIIADQSTAYASFFSHMDADGGLYGSSAIQAISSWLYNQIPSTDERKDAWWRGVVAEPISGTSNQSYCQIKYRFKDKSTRTGDYLIMRAEEMLLIKAEAECQLGLYSPARTTLLELGSTHDSDYSTRLAKFSNSKSYNSNTVGTISTLMDEILFQRRIELWGENGRILDLQRLKLGYNRDFSGSNHTQMLNPTQTIAGSDWFIMMIPQAEIDGNSSITDTDQNPFPKK